MPSARADTLPRAGPSRRLLAAVRVPSAPSTRRAAHRFRSRPQVKLEPIPYADKFDPAGDKWTAAASSAETTLGAHVDAIVAHSAALRDGAEASRDPGVTAAYGRYPWCVPRTVATD